MQPQGPYGQYGPQQPYDPRANYQGPSANGQNPAPYGPPGQPAQGQPLPGQQYPGAIPVPGQPAVPAYQLPDRLRGNGNQPDNLPPPPEAPSTPYDFFMQQAKPAPPVNPLPAKGRRLTGGMNPYANTGPSRNKMILIIGGAVAVIGIIVGIMALVPKDPTGQQLFGLAQTQQEIVRICSDGTSNARAKLRATRNFAITCSASVGANQTELLSYMKKQGYAFNAKQLGLKASGSTDAKLKSATASTSYDSTFRLIMESQLNAYNRSLTAQLGVSDGATIRQILTKSQKAGELLVTMVKDDSDKTEATD